MMLQLYKNIKELRESRGWSQEELASRTGYTSRSTIAKIEKGQVDLPLSKIKLFAEVFNVPAIDLMDLPTEDLVGTASLLADVASDSLMLECLEKFDKLGNNRKHKALGYIDRLIEEQSEQ